MLRSLCLAIAFVVSGCANISTLHRWTWLPGNGQALHLDAPQRVVLTNASGFACAEPSPDALQAYASAIGASFASPDDKAASLSGAMNTGAGSIGLRTQSITLMREMLYRLCESARNQSLTAVDHTQLLQRAQDMTLAVLAIEQLTGAVVARQVLLSGSAESSSSANIANTQAALDAARKNEQLAKDSLTAAQEEEKRQTDAVQKIDDAIAEEKKKPTPVQADLDKLAKQRAAQQGTLDSAKGATKVANDNHLAARKASQAIESNFNAAIATSTAAARGTGSFSEGSDRNYVGKDTVEQIARATTDIVIAVVNKGHLTDTCITLMTQFAKAEPERQQALTYLMGRCETVLDAYLRVWQAQVTKTADAGTPTLAPAPAPSSPGIANGLQPGSTRPARPSRLETTPVPAMKPVGPLSPPMRP
jgi:hypothetical protein